MKNTLLTAAFALACAFSASAQEHHKGMKKSPEERAKHHAEMMDKKLNLSDEQRAQIERIDLKMAQSMKAQMVEMQPQREQMLEKMKTQMAARDAEYQRVLTPAQYSDYQKMQAERREKHRRMAEQRRDRSDAGVLDRAQPAPTR